MRSCRPPSRVQTPATRPKSVRVGEPDRVGLVVERHRRQHRAEHLLAGEAACRRHVAQQRAARRSSRRRRVGDDRALRRRSRCRRAAASARKPRTRSQLRARISGPQSRSASAGPTCSAAKRCAEAREHLLVARALDQQPAARRAGLAGVLHDRVDEHRQRGVEVGVGEHDLRPLAAELQRHRAVPLGRLLRRPHAPVAGEPVNEMCSMPGCAASAAPASRPRPVTMLSAPSGKPDAGGELGDAQQRQARVLGRLHHAGVAGGERAADRAAEDLQRIVPRNDVAGDAVRLAPGQHRVARRDTESSRRGACRRRRRRTRSSARRRRRRRAPASAACRSRAPRAARARRRDRAIARDERARAARPFSAGASRPQAPSRAACAARDRGVDVGGGAARDRARTALPSDGSIIGSVSPRAGAHPAVADEVLRRRA